MGKKDKKKNFPAHKKGIKYQHDDTIKYPKEFAAESVKLTNDTYYSSTMNCACGHKYFQLAFPIEPGICHFVCMKCRRFLVLSKYGLLIQEMEKIDKIQANAINEQSEHTEYTIGFNSLIYVIDKQICIRKKHIIREYIGVLKVILPTGNIEERRLPVFYCCNCCIFMLSKYDYEHLDGHPLCQINDIWWNHPKGKSQANRWQHSKFNLYGYNVQANSKLSNLQRVTILLMMWKEQICSKREIISFLDKNIRLGNAMKWQDAVNKWEKDRAYIIGIRSEELQTIDITHLIVAHNSR